ncbi:phosphoribosylformylglycinamidine synthase-like [Lingula anatina]|uniref:Phosphoribosylformylglycinamidine synthase n=1 Tax=Lingula anatina TaxID=7574 RepID=A0A1S3HUZ4_LINAN|nr:phosphoribosylformylglycinamidine synthase-like [Lingula anatina]XP_013388881.1 phosphoribosylformylglycinamidine synthase-like [Lingula anatina]|eukprot:XP_013388879.1 phosphoribosylformylglycinamidine synthase-like [Lingula anatina]
MPVLRFYRTPCQSGDDVSATKKVSSLLPAVSVDSVKTEFCLYVEVVDEKVLTKADRAKLEWILSTPFEQDKLASLSYLPDIHDTEGEFLIEIGPRLNFSTAFSTNAVSMCHSVGLADITRIEYSTIYYIKIDTSKAGGDTPLKTADVESTLVEGLHDPMTQCRYLSPISCFDLQVKPETVYEVDVIGEGQAALEKVNSDLGLAFDAWDLDYYTKLFKEEVKRNPTNVECFDLAQSNSEHCRHWFFKGRIVVDGQECSDSLFSMIMKTQEQSNPNNVIKFNDNSSAIKGFPVHLVYPEETSVPSRFVAKDDITRHILLTAETHNFPTGVAPFPGATTGTGGRIRDVHSTGTGAHVVAGTAGYCFGNLRIPGYSQPWEDDSFIYPNNFAKPLHIAIEASNGASDYGNKFGEPLLAGFARSCGLMLPGGERREWIKPVMFSGGLGSLDHIHVSKEEAKPGMEVVKVGGPVYRIGVGGGAASSIQVQGDNTSELDFGAVQRGDAEMEQKVNRVIRACIERGTENPIRSIHDQGAGGNGNVLKEIVDPAGAIIRADDFKLGDPTISIMELWGAEYQESNALLIRETDKELLARIGRREKCDVSFVGTVTGDGVIKLENFSHSTKSDEPDIKRSCPDHHSLYPVDLELKHVLGSMPRKVFKLTRIPSILESLELPDNLQVMEALHRVLRLPAVASKRYLTNKVDRSVTGLVAQQQCVGPLHTPLADVAVTALSHFDKVGGATAIGEQPIKGLVDPKCGARMSVGEALTNLVFALVTDLKDVKCSGNWMWAAKLPGEGVRLFDACQAMCDVMQQLGVAVDGGKDSLSMAARVQEDTVKAPGSLVVSTYVGCPDISATVTPDLKCPGGKGVILYVEMGSGHHRLGGSALAQCYKQIGDRSPDLDKPEQFSQAFNITQQLIRGHLLTAGHDVSDGGLVTCLLEMAFAGNCGLDVDIPSGEDTDTFIDVLFAEELGLVLEVSEKNVTEVVAAYREKNIPCHKLGHSLGESTQPKIMVKYNNRLVLENKMADLRDIWEETSFHLERLQTNPQCVEQEALGLKTRTAPPYHLTFDPSEMPADILNNGVVDGMEPKKPKVAVIREEGSNGDREMVAALYLAGFEVWDVNMQDLCTGAISLEQFRGVVFVGGFSYADVLGSSKGWAATCLFNSKVRSQLDAFRTRPDTFSLGVCNGCQLMALLGWVAPLDDYTEETHNQGLYLDHNESGRYESRFPTVKILPSPAIMLQGMEGSVIGIWIAHGEGRFVFKNNSIHDSHKSKHLLPMAFVDDLGNPTMKYPLNPNGSPDGTCAVCSEDGRHLAMMPHPERCVLPWQWPWMPQEWKGTTATSPWLRMFQNAHNWCLQN